MYTVDNYIVAVDNHNICSLIKMLYWMCERSQSSPTWPQLQHAIMRNFGGLQSDKINPLEIFKQKILINREPPDLTGVPKEV